MTESGLNIKGLFRDEQEMLDVIKARRICYDTEPYYISDKKGALTRIGFQLNLYGTSLEGQKTLSPDSPEYKDVERDVRRIAEALSNTCGRFHMCESTTLDSSTITYSADRGMRPDVTVHIPIFDQQRFGHPVDDAVTSTLHAAIGLIESAGVRKKRWHD